LRVVVTTWAVPVRAGIGASIDKKATDANTF
jgi:hypothetical protein